MYGYVLRRILLMIPTCLGITLVTFVILRAAPGEPEAVGPRLTETGLPGLESSGQTDELIRAKRALLGLDKPIHVQYLLWLRRVMTFDFGDSFSEHTPVWRIIGRHVLPSLQINVLSILLIYTLAIPLGVGQAVRRGRLFDRASTVVSFALYASPIYWIGPILLIYFCNPEHRDWFPTDGLSRQFAEQLPFFPWLADRLHHLVLPVVCESYAGIAYLSKQGRASVLENLRADYVRTARAKGVSNTVAILRHALRNSLIPIVTIMALILPAMIGGSVIVETIFSVPGMGWLSFDAITKRDYPVLMAVTTIVAFLTVVALLIQDLMYAWLDPRISYE